MLKESVDKVTKAGIEDYVKISAAVEAGLAKLEELAGMLEAVDPKAELTSLADDFLKGPAAVKAWVAEREVALRAELAKTVLVAEQSKDAVLQSNTANALLEAFA